MKTIENKDITVFLELLLRMAVFLTFFGHGVFAINGNEAWLHYLEYIGFSLELSIGLIFYIGVLDIVVSLVVLLRPNKYIVLWAVIWAFSTALIRPISGESIWAFVERGANWIAPLALFILISAKQYKQETS